MSLHLQHFIAGEATEASDGQRMNLVNPINEEIYASAAQGTAADVARAVAAAKAQLEGGAWSKLSGLQRGQLLHKLARNSARAAARC